MTPTVVFDQVWKKFRRGERQDSLRDLVPSMLRRLRGRRAADSLDGKSEFWALRDVSFTAAPGEAIGIIGPNGAGKSTTLKLLTRLLRPTKGSCRINGRAGALIEVAAGFHPDLTGRENIFLQGAIMGMSRTEIHTHLDAIVAFSGVESFLDTPVKRYSSGMQARLGFSIAAHLNPDVFIVDEVLSVGDISFQARCIERMQEQIRNGVTVVFVSHNLQAVAQLCKRTIVLGQGTQLYDGPTEHAIDKYLKASQSMSARCGTTEPSFRLTEVVLVDVAGVPVHRLRPHTACRLIASIEALADADGFNIGLEFERTRDLLYCYGVASEDLGQPLMQCRRGDVLNITVDFTSHFARGHYRVNLNVRDPRAGRFLLIAENAASFTVDEPASYDGVVDIEPRITVAPQTDREVARVARTASA